jgi:transposase-like protein
MARGAGRDSKKELFWREIVRGHSRSGMSVRAWCRRHALTEPAFYWWRRELAGRDGQNSSVAFVPVRVADDASAAGTAATDTRDAGAGRIEIVLAAERRVHLIGPVDRQALSDVLAVLTKDVRDAEAGARCGRGEAGGHGRAAETHGDGRIAEAGPC